MKVVINGLAGLKPKTGVGHHLANLAAELKRAYPNDRFDLYPGERLSHLARRARPASSGKSKGQGTSSGGWKHRAKDLAKSLLGWHFAGYCRSFGYDLYHEPNFVPFRSHLPTVVTVHDLSVVRYPQWHPADRVAMHTKHFQDAVSRAAHVIVVSEAVRQELIADTGITPDRVTAIYNGISDAFHPQSAEVVARVREELDLPASYFLAVGTIEPRKNLLTVMKAFADLSGDVRSACPLILAGPWGWKADQEREFFEKRGRDAGIRHLGYVSDEALPGLYAGAKALVYPSFYEGFGLPPVEMLASGGAVLASTADAVREVCGRYARFIPPEDVTGWRSAMLGAVRTPDELAALSKGGIEHARQFTWEQAAHQTMAVYRHVQSRSATK